MQCASHGPPECTWQLAFEWGKPWCTKIQFHHSKQAKFDTNCGGVSVAMPCMQVLVEKMQREVALASGGHWGTNGGPCCHGLMLFIFSCKNCLPPCGPKNGFETPVFVICHLESKHPPKITKCVPLSPPTIRKKSPPHLVDRHLAIPFWGTKKPSAWKICTRRGTSLRIVTSDGAL